MNVRQCFFHQLFSISSKSYFNLVLKIFQLLRYFSTRGKQIICQKYLIQMKNKTTNKFRLKDKISRQTYISVDHPKNEQNNSEEQQQSSGFIKHGFSSEYLNLARRFKIKIIPDKFRQKRINIGSDEHTQKESKLRLKTEISRQPLRYIMQPRLNFLQAKPQSLSINQRLTSSSNRNQNYLFFNIHNQNTVYSTQLPHNRVNKDLHLLNEQPGIRLRLTTNANLMNLGNHCKKILNIKSALQKKNSNSKDVVKEIKLYILRQQQCTVAKLEKSFGQLQVQKQIKKLIMLQRIALVSIICNFIGGKLQDHLEQSNRVIEIILGFWYEILSNTYKDSIYQLQTNQSQIKQVMKTLSEARLLTKGTLSILLETVLQKLQILFKNFRDFHEKIKPLVQLSEELSINRAFYELLSQFAVFITEFESKHQINIDSVSFFATCPSPYLIKAATKTKSLVIDLDGTLLYTKVVNKAKNQLETLYRPGCQSFIQELSKHFEIVIFTTSMENYARDVTKKFQNIDYFLFRQHAVRVKHGFVKDLSRIGRDLKKVIILDDLSNNFKLQKENGVKIKSWKGQEDDNELEKIKQILMKIVSSKSDDVKSELNTYRDELQMKKVSFSNTPLSPKECSHQK